MWQRPAKGTNRAYLKPKFGKQLFFSLIEKQKSLKTIIYLLVAFYLCFLISFALIVLLQRVNKDDLREWVL